MTDTVKVLSDDEVAKLLALSQQNTGPSYGYTHELCVGAALLCATVRALRAADKHHYQLWLALKERHKHKFAAVDGKWSDTCQQCGVTTGDDHDGYDCIAWLQRTNTALREQLAEAQKKIRICEQAFELDEAVKIPEVGNLNALQFRKTLDELQSQLAQVTQERASAVDALKEVRRIVGAPEIGADNESWIDDIIEKATANTASTM